MPTIDETLCARAVAAINGQANLANLAPTVSAILSPNAMNRPPWIIPSNYEENLSDAITALGAAEDIVLLMRQTSLESALVTNQNFYKTAIETYRLEPLSSVIDNLSVRLATKIRDLMWFVQALRESGRSNVFNGGAPNSSLNTITGLTAIRKLFRNLSDELNADMVARTEYIHTVSLQWTRDANDFRVMKRALITFDPNPGEDGKSELPHSEIIGQRFVCDLTHIDGVEDSANLRLLQVGAQILPTPGDQFLADYLPVRVTALPLSAGQPSDWIPSSMHQ
jgi:hypothetical protein